MKGTSPSASASLRMPLTAGSLAGPARPTIRAMTHDEIQQLRCVLRAGQEPEPGTLDRVLLTVADLERELLQQTNRGGHARAMDGARIAELEAALRGVAWNEIDGKCWCSESPELAGGNHSQACAAARAALAVALRVGSPAR